MLFFIELGSRRAHLAGLTANPNSTRVTQQARQLAKYTCSFDAVFRSEGLEIIRTPIRGLAA